MIPKLLRTMLAVSALALLAAATPVAAQSATATFQVSANVLKTCTIAANAIAFGNYDPVGANGTAPADQTGTVTIRCTRGTSWSVELGAGDNFSGSRRMRLGATGDYLAYELYSDPSRSVVWDGASPQTGVAASRSPLALTVYGRVPAGQDAVEGAYLDAVAATVNF
jgi:spore coat protein U-like protein